jgi:hypothetical protein
VRSSNLWRLIVRLPKTRSETTDVVVTPQLTIDETMAILRTTVPRLEEVTRSGPQKRLYTVTDLPSYARIK